MKDGEMEIVIQYYGRYDNNPNLKEYDVRLNEHNIYIADDDDDGYRGIVGSLLIKNLYDPKVDDVRMGQCCQSIGIVTKRMFGDLNNQVESNCF
jgi:hypothetical protein